MASFLKLIYHGAGTVVHLLLDLNHGPLMSEATSLPTESLSKIMYNFVTIHSVPRYKGKAKDLQFSEPKIS